jgi:hypothetical protein
LSSLDTGWPGACPFSFAGSTNPSFPSYYRAAMPAAPKKKAIAKSGDESLYDRVQSLLAPYGTKMSSNTTCVKDKRNYTLISKKPAEMHGRKLDEVWFASVIEQKAYTGFYFLPIYTHPELKKELGAGLLKLLKGKSCFHLKSLDAALEADIASALKAGYEHYRKNKFV